MMSSLFSKIKSINQWEKDLVIGYTKEAQKLVIPHQILLDISYLCLIYHYEYDYFNETTENLDTNKDKNTVTIAKQGGIGFAVGKVIIESKIPMIYSWTFQIFKQGTDFYLKCFGISNCTKIDKLFQGQTPGREKEVEWYTMNNFGHAISLHGKTRLDYDYYNLQNGDTIQMVINTKQNDIRYCINNKKQMILFKNIDFKAKQFRMGVCCSDKNYKIKLIKFEKTTCRE